jgi:hypothetical protein
MGGSLRASALFVLQCEKRQPDPGWSRGLRIAHSLPKAVEGHRTPGRCRVIQRPRTARSVVECARPLALCHPKRRRQPNPPGHAVSLFARLLPKAVEGHRTPGRCRVVQRPEPREASWSAPALWRFVIRKRRRQPNPSGHAVSPLRTPSSKSGGEPPHSRTLPRCPTPRTARSVLAVRQTSGALSSDTEKATKSIWPRALPLRTPSSISGGGPPHSRTLPRHPTPPNRPAAPL